MTDEQLAELFRSIAETQAVTTTSIRDLTALVRALNERVTALEQAQRNPSRSLFEEVFGDGKTAL